MVLARTVEVSSSAAAPRSTATRQAGRGVRVTEPEVKQRRERPGQLGEQPGGQPAELRGQPSGQAGDKLAQLAQAKRADLGDVGPPSCEVSASGRSRVPRHTEHTAAS